MKPNNVGKNMWLWTQTAIQKLKQNAQKKDADGMLSFVCVVYLSNNTLH